MKLYTDKVVKIYRSRTVVKEVSVSVSQGEIVGLLGPNGAGKTTTFYMVVGIIKPYSGRVFLESTCEEDKQLSLFSHKKAMHRGASRLPTYQCTAAHRWAWAI